jgi:hypothetical protein
MSDWDGGVRFGYSFPLGWFISACDAIGTLCFKV